MVGEVGRERERSVVVRWVKKGGEREREEVRGKLGRPHFGTFFPCICHSRWIFWRERG